MPCVDLRWTWLGTETCQRSFRVVLKWAGKRRTKHGLKSSQESKGGRQNFMETLWNGKQLRTMPIIGCEVGNISPRCQGLREEGSRNSFLSFFKAQISCSSFPHHVTWPLWSEAPCASWDIFTVGIFFFFKASPSSHPRDNFFHFISLMWSRKGCVAFSGGLGEWTPSFPGSLLITDRSVEMGPSG